jgi:hypothetical protein
MTTGTFDTAFTLGEQRRNSLLSKLLSPAPDFSLSLRNSPEREEVERFIHDSFEDSFAANLQAYSPAILTMRCFDHISGTAGLRPAGQFPLFLEQYLNQDIESLLSSIMGKQIARGDIVEVGNLVSKQRGASHLLFLLFTAMLHQAGYRWIVFTATQGLRNTLKRLGFEFTYLAEARPESLDETVLQDWGSYYSTKPQVVAGDLSEAMNIIQSRPLFRRVARLYRHKINYLAREFKAA